MAKRQAKKIAAISAEGFDSRPPDPQSPVGKLVERFRAAWKRTAEEVIELGSIINEAHAELGEKRLEEFYKGIGLEMDGSTASKLRTIADNSNRFQPVIEMLPNNWTTLYELAKLEPNDFDSVKDAITPETTLANIQSSLKSKTKRQPAENLPVRLTLVVSNIPLPNRGAFGTKFKELLNEFNLELSKPQAKVFAAFLVPNGTSGEAQ